MKDIWVTSAKQGLVIHVEDPNIMERQSIHLSHRESEVLYKALGRTISQTPAWIPKVVE